MMMGPLEIVFLLVLAALLIGWIVALVAAIRSKSTGLAIAIGVVPLFGCLLLGAVGALFFVSAAPAPVSPSVVVTPRAVPVPPPAPARTVVAEDGTSPTERVAEALTTTAGRLGLDVRDGGPTVREDGTCVLEAFGDADTFAAWVGQLEGWTDPPLEVLEFSQVPLEDGRARLRVAVRAGR